jgi:CDP-diacylglycerol--glycerol-3-phosphate 3-phosphatidyltransferase
MDRKRIPSFITGARMVLSPLSFMFLVFPERLGGRAASAIVLWALFIIIELSDLFDGMAARRYGAVSDFGKVFDPFADSFSRLSYFAAFMAIGRMPAIAFLLVLYRDLLVSFGRLLMAKRGVSMPARLSGKLKAVAYAVAGFLGLARETAAAFAPLAALEPALGLAALAAFWVCAAVAVWTALDYLLSIRAYLKKHPS